MKVKMEGGSGKRKVGDISLLGYFSRRSLGTFLSVIRDLTSLLIHRPDQDFFDVCKVMKVKM